MTGNTGMPAAPVSTGVNAKLASTLLHEARRIKCPNTAQLSQQLAVPAVLAEAINSVSATEVVDPVGSFAPFAPVTVNGISPIDLVAVLDVRILEVFFPLTGGLLSQHTYGFEMYKSKDRFNVTNAFALGKLAQLVYWDMDFIKLSAEKWGFTQDDSIVPIDVATLNGQCLMVRNRDTHTGKTMVAIVFRGTRPVYLQYEPVLHSTGMYAPEERCASLQVPPHKVHCNYAC
eukprot:17778-Heterococcus_DN1.PRE.3